MTGQAHARVFGEPGAAGRRTVWAAGLLVAFGAGVTTAHGLYQVAVASGVPAPVGWLYPLITDGLALVAYAATTRLADAGRRYAWAVVVLAAGLSGLAQASLLADRVANAPTTVRFGVGAWPAVAVAIVAHLVYLLGVRHDADVNIETVRPGLSSVVGGHAVNDVVQLDGHRPTEPSNATAYSAPIGRTAKPADTVQRASVQSRTEQVAAVPAARPSESPARDRARAAARSHLQRSGHLPTVTELTRLAQVARGTAGAVLKGLRDQPAATQADDRPAEAAVDPPTEASKSQRSQQNDRPPSEQFN